LLGEGDHAANVVAGGDVGTDEACATAPRFYNSRGLLAGPWINIGDYDEGAVGPEPERDLTSGTSGSAGH